MILLICLSNDNGIVKVCKWLKYYGYEFAIITEKNFIKYNFSDGEIAIKIDSNEYLNIKTGWIRNPFLLFDKPILQNEISDIVEKYIFTDLQKNQDFILNHLKNSKKFLGTVNTQDINKLVLFEYAINLGIKIPKYIVTGSKNKLLGFTVQYPSVITKTIGWNINFTIGTKKHFAYTELITPDFLDTIPDSFQHSFFQEYINADLELRVVIVENNVFTMAHQKQKNMTEIDLRKRKINDETFPFKLPPKVGFKLMQLMAGYNLDFCVFDILLFNDTFYLIDINPTGQFTDVSQKCNYNIELEIAKILINRNDTI